MLARVTRCGAFLDRRPLLGVARPCWSRFVTSGGKKPDSQELHQMYQEQMMDMKAERELLFGFTPDEHDAWTNASNHQHDKSFMEQLQSAREEADENDDTGASMEIHARAVPPSVSPAANAGLSHISHDGQSIQMVNVGGKQSSQRVAVAQSRVVFPPEVSDAFRSEGYNKQTNELVGPKGPIFQCAKLAGIMAAK